MSSFTARLGDASRLQEINTLTSVSYVLQAEMKGQSMPGLPRTSRAAAYCFSDTRSRPISPSSPEDPQAVAWVKPGPNCRFGG
jgi:hypothetical protein